MRMHAIWVLGCSLGLTACLLSDFREAERLERERMRVDSVRTVDTDAAARADAGLAQDAGQAGRRAVSSQADSGAAAVGGGGSSARAGASAGGAGAAASVGGADAGAAASAGGAGAGMDAGTATSVGGANAGAGGAGGGGGAGASADAGTVEEPDSSVDAGSSCGDTTSNPEHCGRCDNACYADMALASCVDARCVRACASGFGDCNADLAFGAEGDGCEVDLSEDLAHCGGCGSRCEPQPGTVGFCADRECQLHALQVDSGAAVADLHGHPEGGDPYDQLCGRDEAQVGIDVASDGNFILGLGVRCAPLGLSGSRDAMSVQAGAVRAFPLLGNRAGEPVAPVAIECPPGTLISGISGATGYFMPDNTLFTVKALSLHCARTIVTDTSVELEPSSVQSAGSLMGNVVETFTDECPAGQAVVGFTGRAGHLVDAVQTLCAPISITQRPQWR